MLRKRWGASVTVEAAFVVPIVIFAILALIYFAFYLHDRVRAETIAERALEKGVHFSAQQPWMERIFEREAVEQVVEGDLEEELKSGFFFLEKESISCEANGLSVSIQIKMKGKISLNPVGSLWAAEPGFALERGLPIHDPPELLRAYKAMGLTMDGRQEESFVKSHVNGLLQEMER